MKLITFASLLLVSSTVVLAHPHHHSPHDNKDKIPAKVLRTAPVTNKDNNTVLINPDSVKENKWAKNVVGRRFYYFTANHCKPELKQILSGRKIFYPDESKLLELAVEICPEEESCGPDSMKESPCRYCAFEIFENSNGYARTNKVICEDSHV